MKFKAYVFAVFIMFFLSLNSVMADNDTESMENASSYPYIAELGSIQCTGEGEHAICIET